MARERQDRATTDARPRAAGTTSTSAEDRIRRLAATVGALRHGESFSITKLTAIKSLCANPEDAHAFVLHVARLARRQLEGKHGYRPRDAEVEKFRTPVVRAMGLLERHRRNPGSMDTEKQRACLFELSALQNRHRNVAWGTVRIIESMPALIVEKALRCILFPEHGPRWAYEVARDYCRRYDPQFGTELIPASAPRLEEVVEFLSRYHLRRPLRVIVRSKPSKKASRAEKKRAQMAEIDSHSLASRYPALAAWVQDGWVEIGRVNWTQSFARALDEGGQVWEGKSQYPSLEAALADMDRGIAEWVKKTG